MKFNILTQFKKPGAKTSLVTEDFESQAAADWEALQRQESLGGPDAVIVEAVPVNKNEHITE